MVKNNSILPGILQATIVSSFCCLTLIFLFPILLQGMQNDERIQQIEDRQNAALNVLTFTDDDYFRIALRLEQINEIAKEKSNKRLKKFIDDINDAIESIIEKLPSTSPCYQTLKPWIVKKFETVENSASRIKKGIRCPPVRILIIGIPNKLYIPFNFYNCTADTLISTVLNIHLNLSEENMFLTNSDRIDFIKNIIVVKIVRVLNFKKLLENEKFIPNFLDSFKNKKWLLFLGLFENILFHASDPVIQEKSNQKGEENSIWRSETVQMSNIDFLNYLIENENIRLLLEEKKQLEPIIQKGLSFCRNNEYQDEYDQKVVNTLEESFEKLFQKPVQEPNQIEIIPQIEPNSNQFYKKLILRILGIAALGGLGIYAILWAKKQGYIKK